MFLSVYDGIQVKEEGKYKRQLRGKKEEVLKHFGLISMISREFMYHSLVCYDKNKQGKYTFLPQLSEKEGKKKLRF